MQTVQTVRCPTCGNLAERQLLRDRLNPACDRIVRTACPICDYLMVMCLPTGKVIEAYAPGQPSHDRSVLVRSRSLAHAQPHHSMQIDVCVSGRSA